MKHINKMTDRELIDYEFKGAWNEGGTSDLASELAYRFDNLISKRKSVKYNVNKLIKKVHKQNKKAGWWNDLYSGGSITDPEKNKTYKLSATLNGKVLNLKGHLGPFSRSQTWQQK